VLPLFFDLGDCFRFISCIQKPRIFSTSPIGDDVHRRTQAETRSDATAAAITKEAA
jgi:hypothetical protein